MAVLLEFWPVFLGMATLMTWLIRLESRVRTTCQNNKRFQKELDDHRESSKENEIRQYDKIAEVEKSFYDKFDLIQKSLSDISHALGVIQGKMGIKDKD